MTRVRFIIPALLMIGFWAGLAGPAQVAFAQQAPATPLAKSEPPKTEAQPVSVGARGCNVPRELARFDHSLNRLAQAVVRDRIVHIIALGSSSTAGSGASSPQASYPARLDAELDRRFPGRDFQVANFGTGGLLARDMVERLHTHIIALKPALVIWQTGVNDAIQDVGLEAFRETLQRGVRDMKAAGIDVILVNHQFYPRAERVAGYVDYLTVMREVAEAERVPVFRRFAIMKHLVKSGQHTSEELLAPDNFHLNDLSYGCLADLMADAIDERIKAGRITASQLLPVQPQR
ncbi:MAG: SGNH/GDSL hydrolase family protein [Hyphomicrobiaceae bacterium]